MIRGIGTFLFLAGAGIWALGFYLLGEHRGSPAYAALSCVMVMAGLILSAFGLARRSAEKDWRRW